MDWHDEIEEDVTSAAFYRARAKLMLEQAQHAANDEIKQSCLGLAQSWERLAAHAEQSAHMLPPTYGRSHDGAPEQARAKSRPPGPERPSSSGSRYR